VLRLVHGITIATETSPADADRLLALVLDGLRPQAAAPAPAPLAGPGPSVPSAADPASEPSTPPSGEISG
jgi:hypothetical protein